MFGKDATNVSGFTNTNQSGTQYLRNTVKANLYSGDTTIEDKLVQAQLNWRFYNNRHWADNNDQLLSFNYVRAVIDKVNNFIAGKEGFEVNIVDDYGEEVDENTEKTMEALLNYNWRKNKRVEFIQKLLQMGSISGDAYIFPEVIKSRGFIKYNILDSRVVIPKFKNGDYTEIESYRVVKTLAPNDEKFIQKVTEYSVGNVRTYYVRETGENAEKFQVENTPNDLDFIPMIHIQNIAMSEGYGGKSDVEDIIVLNKTYNEMGEDVKMVIDYYAQPTTIITGGTIGQVKRGINQIWSGLPSDANVFNLGLGEDMSASLNFMKMIKDAIHDLTGVPEEVLSKVQHISNTSAAALQMLLQPLIMVADKKCVTYGAGIEELMRVTFLLFKSYLADHPLFQKLPADAQADSSYKAYFDRYRGNVIFKYNLPSDRMAMLNEAQLEIQNGVGSRKEIMERLGKRNIPMIMSQIDEDTDRKVKMDTAVFEAKQNAFKQEEGGVSGAEKPKPADT